MQESLPAVYQTEIEGAKLKARGKVRDIYELDGQLLIVATDRLSAFDYVLPDPIPGKGKVLNQLSEFWFRRFEGIIPNHVVTTDVGRFPAPFLTQRAQLEGRTTLARKLEMPPVECVARGYLAGSGWKEYQEQGTVCGIQLPPGLMESSELPEPIFTPATKAQEGHDINISFEEMQRIVGAELAVQLRDKTLEIYAAGAQFARERGIIIADTKFEFGLDDGELVLADEVLTPDSSRFWPEESYAPGRGQPSFDKQYVRDYLLELGWNKQPPVPDLPQEIIQGTRERYREIFSILTGSELA